MDEDTPVGRRIAYYRNQRGITQEVLAGLVDRSASWLQKIESGERVMDSASMLEQLADVLEVAIWDLRPKFGLPRNGGAPNDSARMVDEIRHALFRPLPDREVPDIAALSATAAEASRLRSIGHYKPVAILLPDVLTGARASATQETAGAWECLASACKTAMALVREIGEWEFALLLADRFATAARSSGDPLLMAASARHLGFALLDIKRADTAAAVCSDAADAIAPTKGTSVEGWSMWGSLQLTGAVAATRLKDPTSARRLLADAWSAAERVGPDHRDYVEAFGPANVGLHEISIALDSHNPTEALRIADRVDVDALPLNSRRAAYCIDVARAHALRGFDTDAAVVGWLLEAYDYAPDRARTQVLPRALVEACLRREKKSRTPKLRELAAKIGITA